MPALQIESTGSSHEISGGGFTVRITEIASLKGLLAEIKTVNRRVDELRTCSMVLVLDVALDESRYDGVVYTARAPFGTESRGLPAEYVGACEALNIKLARFKPIVFDTISGFYPQV
jgi:hypothetical protein